MRLPSARFWTFLIISALTAVRMDAQSSLKESPAPDSAYAIAMRQYHLYVAPEVGLYRGTQYIDYDYTVQMGQPFFGPDSIRNGSVWYGGVAYDHVRMLYDLVKGQVVILDPYNIFKIALYMDLVDSFALDGHTLVRIRDSLAPAWMRSTYFEPIYRGGLVLLKRERKFLHENIVITPDNIRLFIDGKNEYYLKKGGGYHSVNTREALFDLLKDRRSDIKRVIRKSKLKWHRDKVQLLQLAVAWYDSANHLLPLR
jgi:hypothetical protein